MEKVIRYTGGFKRVLSIVLVFAFLLFVVPFVSPSANAVIAIGSFAAAAVVFIAACGLTWIVNQGSSDGFQSSVQRLMENYAVSNNQTVGEWIDTDSVIYTPVGKIYYSKSITEKMNDFVGWIVDEHNIVDSGDAVVLDNGYEAIPLTAGQYMKVGNIVNSQWDFTGTVFQYNENISFANGARIVWYGSEDSRHMRFYDSSNNLLYSSNVIGQSENYRYYYGFAPYMSDGKVTLWSIPYVISLGQYANVTTVGIFLHNVDVSLFTSSGTFAVDEVLLLPDVVTLPDTTVMTDTDGVLIDTGLGTMTQTQLESVVIDKAVAGELTDVQVSTEPELPDDDDRQNVLDWFLAGLLALALLFQPITEAGQAVVSHIGDFIGYMGDLYYALPTVVRQSMFFVFSALCVTSLIKRFVG